MPQPLSAEPTSAPGAWNGLLCRRDLLRIGALGLSASLFSWNRSSATTNRKEPAGRAKSVILLWMAGGVTHIDSFDPKPDAPAEIRGTLGAVATAVPGIRFNETMPCLARQAHRLAVLRSYSHGNNDHFESQAYALSGRRVTAAQITTEPNIGAVVSRLHGPRAGLPGYIAVPGTTRPGPPPKNLFVGGWLGSEHAPFATGGTPRNEDFTAKVREASEDEFNQQALTFPSGMDGSRLAGRQSLRGELDGRLRAIDAAGLAGTLDRQYHGAFTMLLAPAVRRSFELRREPEPMRERYGHTKIGQRCLLARRLVEAGARFVMVDYGYDPEFGNLWDNHNAPTQDHPPICEMVKKPYHLAGTDRALAALVEDLTDRGLLDETLVVFLTEFGRTPKINARGGRDHWGAAGSLCFAGGGVRGGQVIGATDKHAAQPTGVAYGPGDVAATIYHALGIDLDTVLHDRQGRPIPMLPEGQVIPGLTNR